ncbi:LOW QUALITY PROTEIN: hypothetical protein U9M48_028899 [Paspalum notatum var. saurae]|uniref:Uncharacterized protein n=1 Tax=Paspalum notatum var. saurae TaxID=547442 RepID=A0AAQ3TXR9_PASNO
MLDVILRLVLPMLFRLMLNCIYRRYRSLHHHHHPIDDQVARAPDIPRGGWANVNDYDRVR